MVVLAVLTISKDHIFQIKVDCVSEMFLLLFIPILNLFNEYIFVIFEVQSKRYSCAARVQKWSLGYKKEGTMLSFRGTVKKVYLCHLGVQKWSLGYKPEGTMLSHKVHICSLEVQTKKVQ